MDNLLCKDPLQNVSAFSFAKPSLESYSSCILNLEQVLFEIIIIITRPLCKLTVICPLRYHHLGLRRNAYTSSCGSIDQKQQSSFLLRHGLTRPYPWEPHADVTFAPQQNSYTSLNGSNLTIPVPQTATRQLFLVNSQNRVDGRKRNVLNGVAYVDPQVG